MFCVVFVYRFDIDDVYCIFSYGRVPGWWTVKPPVCGLSPLGDHTFCARIAHNEAATHSC